MHVAVCSRVIGVLKSQIWEGELLRCCLDGTSLWRMRMELQYKWRSSHRLLGLGKARKIFYPL